MGNDLMTDDAAMSAGSLPSQPSININGEPMLKILGNRHLGRINVSPFIPAIEEPIKLRLGFSFGSVERDVSGYSFPTNRITTKIELKLPSLLTTLTKVSLALISHYRLR